MSWLPVYNAWGVMLFILSVFLWKLEGLLLFLFIAGFSILFLVKESIVIVKHFASGFWMFILSEVMAFGTLFFMCLCSEEGDVSSLSDFFELPFLGCFILIGSSITASAYHHYLGSWQSRVFLLLTIFLGCCFILLQVFEFYDCECDLTYCVYQACCLCTVGLHFSHVVGGVVALSWLYFLGEGAVSQSNINFVVWYWHFVDYIWLLVFLIIYVS
uniref:Cytochrome c oxidase subunit 3 n=1 Tax=Tracheophilus cymbius TaxID=2502951 RepID=A0A516IAE2_9TREM|nr:cytochrome c oxidase subunit III [Tracheophilus cymbius]QDP13008.1 cytochrome c oxidase subunit 3 [Tracheophilus cymbius]